MSSPYTATKSWFGAKHRPWLLIFQSTTSLSHKQFVPLSKIVDDVIARDLWFAPPLNQKSWNVYDCTRAVHAGDNAFYILFNQHSIFFFFASSGKQIALLLLYPNFVRRNKNQQDIVIHYCNALYFVKIV